MMRKAFLEEANEAFSAQDARGLLVPERLQVRIGLCVVAELFVELNAAFEVLACFLQVP